MDNQSKIQLFTNEELDMKVRVVEINGEPWLVGKDVAEVLGYANPSKAVLNHVDPEDKIMEMITHSQNGNVVKTQTSLINESGLYSLVLRSKLPEAKKFKRWVTSEVLPSIRKHGMYATDDLLNDPDLMIEAANKIKEEREGRLKAESQVKELTDKVVKLSIDVNNLEKRTVKGTTLTDISCCTDTPRRLIEDYCFSMGWYSKKNNEVIIHDITLVTATRRNAIEFTSKGAEILIQQFSKNGKLF